MFKRLVTLLKDDRGATSIEYGFTLILVFLAVVGSWAALGDALSGLYDEHSEAMAQARQDSNSE